MDRQLTWDTMSPNGPQEQHLVNCRQAIQITHEYIGSLKDYYETDAELIRDTCFRFCIDKNNFLEITLDSRSEYRVRFTCQIERPFLGSTRKENFARTYKTNTVIDLDNVIHHLFAFDPVHFKAFFLQRELQSSDTAASTQSPLPRVPATVAWLK